MAMIKCKECKAEMSDKAPKFPNCGCPNLPKVSCPECGTDLSSSASTCPKCGCAIKTSVNGDNKSKVGAGLLGIFLGWLGIHNFYLGYTGKAVAQLLLTVLSCGILSVVSGIWGFIEGIMILTGSVNTDADGNPLVN